MLYRIKKLYACLSELKDAVIIWGFQAIFLLNHWRPRMVKNAAIVIDMVSIQNLLAPFCCVFEKNTLRHFLLLNGLGKQL